MVEYRELVRRQRTLEAELERRDVRLEAQERQLQELQSALDELQEDAELKGEGDEIDSSVESRLQALESTVQVYYDDLNVPQVLPKRSREAIGDGVHIGDEPGGEKQAAFAENASGQLVVEHLTMGPDDETGITYYAMSSAAGGAPSAPYFTVKAYTETVDAKKHGQVAVGDTTYYVEITNLSSLYHPILDATFHSDSVAQDVTRGSLIYGNATPKWDELVIGAAGTLLVSDGTDVSWSSNITGNITITGVGAVNPFMLYPGADNVGFVLWGYDDKSEDYLKGYVDASGEATFEASGKITFSSLAGHMFFSTGAGKYFFFTSHHSFYINLGDADGTYSFYVRDSNSASVFDVNSNGNVFCRGLKQGATQAAAGAGINELWYTVSHASLPDGVVMIGTS